MMGTYGIQTQTPHEVEPVQIWPPKELVKVYEHLGLSKRLGLQVIIFASLKMNAKFTCNKYLEKIGSSYSPSWSSGH